MSEQNENISSKFQSNNVRFADVAHQTLLFNCDDAASQLVLNLIDTRWAQRLRDIRQTGNTHLVYMFSEHSRFGHSLGVAYLAITLMNHLANHRADLVEPYRKAVAAAALLHDIGHTAPGSHLAETIWGGEKGAKHETISVRAIREDEQLQSILGSETADLVARILSEDSSLPSWTTAIISGGGWNADRGNWAIVDSAMCSVTYGRYNVSALIDAFRLSDDGQLVLQENRLDALTHFFVARDSMYRQVYQHRVLQAVDALTSNIVIRLRDIISNTTNEHEAKSVLDENSIFFDNVMLRALTVEDYTSDLLNDELFAMTESWWRYHLHQWCQSGDAILSDLASRLRDRRLFKTIRVDAADSAEDSPDFELVQRAESAAQELGFDPRYYVSLVRHADKHRRRKEEAPLVLLEKGNIVPVTDVEPMIASILEGRASSRNWIATPAEVKAALGRVR